MPTVKPLALLTVRRISRLSDTPVSVIHHVLDEHPEIQPTAVADGRDVFDREAFLALLALTDQYHARRMGGAK